MGSLRPYDSNRSWFSERFATKQSRIIAAITGGVLLLLLLAFNTSSEGISRLVPTKHASCALTGSCPKRAISTILTGPSFLPGIITLAYSISKHAPNADKLILVPTDWSSKNIKQSQLDTLQNIGYKLKFFDALPLPASVHGERVMNERFADLLLKLRAWSLVEYTSIALLDADILLHSSLDDAFDLLEESTANLGAVASPAMAVEPFYDMVAGHFNGGVLFLKPDTTIYTSLVEKSSQRDEYATIELAEQSFLNTQYTGTYLGLPVRYNTANVADYKTYFKRFVVDTDWDFSILHFLGALDHKPWSNVVNSNADVQKGRDMWKKEYEAAMLQYGISQKEAQ